VKVTLLLPPGNGVVPHCFDHRFNFPAGLAEAAGRGAVPAPVFKSHSPARRPGVFPANDPGVHLGKNELFLVVLSSGTNIIPARGHRTRG
jgi:hypothetical protein